MPRVEGNPVAPSNGEYLEERKERFDNDGIDEGDIIAKAKSNIGGWQSYFSQNLLQGRDDANFLYRDQWGLRDKQAQNTMQKLSLEFNKLRPTVRKIVGEQRQNKPDLIVRSLNGRASEQEIDLRADLVRSISYQSQCELVYQAAFNSSLSRGFGAFQIGIDYENELSFKQVIRYNIVQDISMCSFDSSAVEPHKGDGNFCGRNYIMGRRQFMAENPWIGDPNSFTTEDVTQNSVNWVGSDERPVVICDYFDRSHEPFKLYLLSDGQTMSEEDWEAMQDDLKKRGQIAKDSLILRGLIESDIPTIRGERMSQRPRITHYRLLDDCVIDYSYWPSKYLPLIFVDGDSQYIDGQQFTSSFIHDAIDSQRFYNYVYSEIATEIRNRRKEQWLGTPDNIAGFEDMWRNPESQRGILIAKPHPGTGAMPQKLPPWEVSQTLLALCGQSTQDMREIMGFAETEINGSRDVSGAAKMQRRLDAAQSTYIYHDNLNQAIAQGGRVVLDLLPIIYGGDERGMVVTKADGQTKNIVLNKQMPNGKVENGLSKGDYDIEIDTGPSFAVQKEAALEMFMGLVQANPQIFPMVADLIAKNLDVQFRPQIEERFKNFVPPEILAKEAGEPPPEKKPDPMQQMAEMQMKLQEGELKEKEQELAIRHEQHQLDKEKHQIDKAKLYMEMNKVKAQMAEVGAKNRTENRKIDLDYETEMAKLMHASRQKE